MNKVILVGAIGQNAEVKDAGSTKVARFSLATNKRWKDKEGNKKEQTEWHNIECWDKLADIAEKYFLKGTKLAIEGELKTDKYEKDGITQYRTKIVLKEFEFVGGGESKQSDTEPAKPIEPGIKQEPESDLPF